MNYLKILTFFIVSTLLPSIHAETISEVVDGGMTSGVEIQCTAYLHIPDKSPPNNNFPLYFTQYGGGGVGLEMSTISHDIFESGTIAPEYFLTMDKPGIKPDPNFPTDPTKYIINHNQYDFFSPDNLGTCAQNSIYWAFDRLNNKNRPILIHGFSEGTVVVSNMIKKIFLDNNRQDVKNNLKALFLTGLLMDKMIDVFDYEIRTDVLTKEDYNNIMAAYNIRDNKRLFDLYGQGASWFDYMLNPNTPTIKDILDYFLTTDQGKKLQIEFMQGLNDTSVDPQSVKDYENINFKRDKANKLNLQARYYNANHALDQPDTQPDIEHAQAAGYSDLHSIKMSILNQ